MNVLRFAHRLPPSILIRPLSTTSVALSGHNKWSKIKHKKGANDMKKGELYGKAARDIILAIRQGGNADPEVNGALAAVIKRARSQGVPKDNIEACIKKAVAKGDNTNSQAITYEAMSGTVGMIIECLSDNAKRTVLKLRETLSKKGGRFAPVAFMFQRQGNVRVALEQDETTDERVEKLIEAALEAGAEDFEQHDPSDSEGVLEIEFTCPPASLSSLTSALLAPGLCKELLGSELIYAPVDPAEPPDEEMASKLSELIEELEEQEDTLRVWTTLDG